MPPDPKVYPLWMACRRCFRQAETLPYEWCALCLSKLAIVAEDDQQEAAVHHLASVSNWRYL